MPRTPEQNQNIKDKRRAKLLTFALKAFAANGFDHTAIDDITKPAKCSHGLFYHYFDSKEAVFAALIDEIFLADAEVPVQAALEKGGTEGIRLLCDYAEKVAKSSFRELCVAKITLFLGEDHNLDDKGSAYFAHHDIEKALVTLIRQGQAEGKVVAGDPRAIAIAFLDMAKGASVRLSAKDHASAVDADILFGMFLKAPLGE